MKISNLREGNIFTIGKGRGVYVYLGCEKNYYSGRMEYFYMGDFNGKTYSTTKNIWINLL